jgi:hypothetical protein
MTRRSSIIRMTETNSITPMTQQYHTNDLKNIILTTETNGIILDSTSIITNDSNTITLLTQRVSHQRLQWFILMTETNGIILMTQTVS